MVESIVELIPGVSKRILKPGENGPLPQEGEQVTVHYEGKLENGTVFDCSYEREPFQTAIGVG